MRPVFADMAGRRIVYLAALAFCGIFYIAYGQWLSWLVLIAVLALPWFSLLLSLPAMLRFRGCPGGPSFLEMGGEAELWLIGSCPFPMPPFRGRLKLRRLSSGESWYYQDKEDLPTGHCGGIALTAESLRVCDYLGLFSFPARSRDERIILIRPRPVSMDPDRDVPQSIVRSWKPKSGGGYGENHELRPYRPGDGLNQIHWKLSAKTGDLIIREPMEPHQGLVLLTMNLRGSPEEQDRKFGRLLWLGQHLAKQDIRFELRVMTGDGLLTFPIATESGLNRIIDTLLCKKAAPAGRSVQPDPAACWHCHIGGEPDES